MHQPWKPEREVSVDLARSLIESQFPDLTPVIVEPFGVGWDNVAYRVNGRYVFRFPQRQLGGDLMAHEVAALPWVAGAVPLCVPNPIYVGRPAGDYPWTFAGYEIVPGRTACRANLSDDQRIAAVPLIARALAALRSLSPAEALKRGVPMDPLERANPDRRTPIVRDRIVDARNFGLCDARTVDVFHAIVDAALAGPRATPEQFVVCHGDLYVRHLIVDDAGALTGVIDWGDVHLGDPAVDLGLAHTFLPPNAHGEFREAYARECKARDVDVPIDDATWARARFAATVHTTALLVYARDAGDADLAREAVRACEWLCTA